MENFKNELLVIIELKIELSPFIYAVLDDTIELISNSKFNDLPFVDFYTHDQLIQVSLRHFVSSAKSLLLTLIPDSAIVFRGIPLKDYYYRKDNMLSQLSQLSVPNSL